jgi:hypothetical protein
MKGIKEILKDFLRDNPNGSKSDFVKYYRQKEKEFIEQKFIKYRDGKLKELNKELYKK